MQGDELLLSSAKAQLAALRSRRVSAVELAQMALSRISRLNPPLNAVVTLDPESALRQAEEADKLLARQGAPPPLCGLVATVKDAIEVEGLRSTGGARELSDHVPAADAPAVARLRAAGAVIMGKTNVPRFSSDIQTYNDLFGTTNNPWDLALTPGGSSGGAAAAVAAGLTSFEIGTDIGGSIRIPSHFCGVYGHKPTFGLIPQQGYLDRLGGNLGTCDINVFGPIARSAEDLDLLLGVLAGPDDESAKAWSLRLPPPRHERLGDWKVGVWLDDPAFPVDREVGRVLSHAVDLLSDAGAQVVLDRPGFSLEEAIDCFNHLLLAAVSPSVGDLRRAEALSGSHLAWLHQDQTRTSLRRAWATYFQSHDALLCPVMPVSAFPHDQAGSIGSRLLVVNDQRVSHRDCFAWVGMVGVAYLPATVVPAGLSSKGVPVGLQVVGPYLEDRSAIALASILGQLTGGYLPPPLAR